MPKHDRERRFKEALDHVLGTGRLRPSDLQLPIWRMSSFPTFRQNLDGYEGGAFDPLTLGVACIVVPSSDRVASVMGDWNLNPVRTPSLPPPDPPPASISILLRKHRSVREFPFNAVGA